MISRFLNSFPEFDAQAIDSMRASEAFFQGLIRRINGKRDKKIFIIGFHKTGTSSLGKALQILGYRVAGSHKTAYDYNKVEFSKTFILKKAETVLERYDAFQDTPWFLYYNELHEKYPNAYFILTIREDVKWLASVQNHFKNYHFPFHDLIYENYNSLDHPDAFLDVYNTHNKLVSDFFYNNDKFITFEIGKHGWSELCHFLGVKIPKVTFPFANKKEDRKGLKAWIRRKVN